MTATTAPSLSGSRAKLLVTCGAFSAVYFVLVFATGMIGLVNPALMLVGWALSILLNGTVVMLLLAKTRNFWSLPILGTVVGLVMLPSGHPWFVPVAGLALGLLASVIARLGRYRSRSLNSLAYAVFSLWYISPMLPIFYAADAYYRDIEAQMGPEYTQGMRALLTPTFLLGWSAVVMVLALVAGWIGTALVRKHFSRAGLA